MLCLFLLISFSFCKKKYSGFWNLPKMKELQKNQKYIQVAAFFDSFSPENSDSNIISSALNCFRSYIISYKKSYVVKNVRKYLLHKKNIKDLRKLWDKDSKMQKKEI